MSQLPLFLQVIVTGEPFSGNYIDIDDTEGGDDDGDNSQGDNNEFDSWLVISVTTCVLAV